MGIRQELLVVRGREEGGASEADLALLPTLTRTWMRRGEQLKVPPPGSNEKRLVREPPRRGRCRAG